MTILSTKRLQSNQRELLLNAGMSFVEYDAIKIKQVGFTLPRKLENVIITSQNGGRAILTSELSIQNLQFFCVGEKTESLLIQSGLNVIKTAQNGAELAHFIAKNHKKEHFTYFCGAQRRDELPNILKEAEVTCNEVVVYETYLNEKSFNQEFDGILFFSPSGVESFGKANHPSTPLRVRDEMSLESSPSQDYKHKNTSSPERSRRAVFCIGETTATTARMYFETVIVSNATTIESTIAKAVSYLRKKNH